MTITPEQKVELIKILKKRFDSNMNRHFGIVWKDVQSRLEANLDKMWSLNEMEKTGGEPDVVGYDKKQELTFFTIALLKVQKEGEALVMTKKA